MHNETLITVPSHGLGDVLYHSLALSYLKEYKYSKCVIFCPENCIEIPGLFDVTGLPYYSKLLKNKLPLNRKNELQFWNSLKKYKGADFFSTYNDVIDRFICRVSGFRIVNGGIGNYFAVFKYGSRSLANKFLSSDATQRTNPKHFFARIHHVLSSIYYIPQADLLLYFRKKLLEITGAAQQEISRVVIFPDSGSNERMLTHDQVKYIVNSYKETADIIIYSGRSFEDIACSNITVLKFGSIKQTIENTLRASLIFTTDSFPAHFSALCGIRTMVIYQRPKFKKYCEYWGAPYDNVLHFEEGIGYKLNGSFEAREISYAENDTDIAVARKVSSLILN